MVLLIDTNIVLDVLLNRPEFVKDSALIWKLCETEQAKGYISTLTYANMMYVMRKQLTPDQNGFMQIILSHEILKILPKAKSQHLHQLNFWQESEMRYSGSDSGMGDEKCLQYLIQKVYGLAQI